MCQSSVNLDLQVSTLNKYLKIFPRKSRIFKLFFKLSQQMKIQSSHTSIHNSDAHLMIRKC